MIVVILIGVVMCFLWLLIRVNHRKIEPKPKKAGEFYEKAHCDRSGGGRRNSVV
jgi:hypothetical protein